MFESFLYFIVKTSPSKRRKNELGKAKLVHDNTGVC